MTPRQRVSPAPLGVPDTLVGDLDPANKVLAVNDARPEVALNANCTSSNAFRPQQSCLPELGDDTQVAQLIDYLFASTALIVKKWEIVLDLDAQRNWLGIIPSDHNQVRATITLPGVTR